MKSFLHLYHKLNNFNNIKIISILKNNPNLIYKQDYNGHTLFYYFLKYNNTIIIKFIINNYATEDLIKKQYNYNNESCLFFAIYNNNLELVKLLLNKYPFLININNINNQSCLIPAYFSSKDIFKYMIEHYPNLIFQQDNDENNILDLTINYKDIDTSILLMTKFTNLINIRKSNGNTYLHILLKDLYNYFYFGDIAIFDIEYIIIFKYIIQNFPYIVFIKNNKNETVLTLLNDLKIKNIQNLNDLYSLYTFILSQIKEKYFIPFLMGYHKKLGNNSLIQCLDLDMIKLILNYLLL